MFVDGWNVSLNSLTNCIESNTNQFERLGFVIVVNYCFDRHSQHRERDGVRRINAIRPYVSRSRSIGTGECENLQMGKREDKGEEYVYSQQMFTFFGSEV